QSTLHHFTARYTVYDYVLVHFPAYNGRVEFNNTTFSLTLKNLTKNDAGTYTVKGDDEEGENIIVVHTLTVLGKSWCMVLTGNTFLNQQHFYQLKWHFSPIVNLHQSTRTLRI
uniref:Immunoglobulin V-set domain-containing protein n=1 Tax=Electrophorus electricus TaxID=8005 RepID=A0AAY5EZH9_ELEEL